MCQQVRRIRKEVIIQIANEPESARRDGGGEHSTDEAPPSSHPVDDEAGEHGPGRDQQEGPDRRAKHRERHGTDGHQQARLSERESEPDWRHGSTPLSCHHSRPVLAVKIQESINGLSTSNRQYHARNRSDDRKARQRVARQRIRGEPLGPPLLFKPSFVSRSARLKSRRLGLLRGRRLLLPKLGDLTLQFPEDVEDLLLLGLLELPPVLQEVEQQERDHAKGACQIARPQRDADD